MAIEMVYDEAVQLSSTGLWEQVTGFFEDPGVYLAMIGIGELDGSEEIHVSWFLTHDIDWGLFLPTPGANGVVPAILADSGQNGIQVAPLAVAADQVASLKIYQVGGTPREFRVVVNRMT